MEPEINGTSPAPPRPGGPLAFARYALRRLATLGATLVVAVFLTVLIANMGGFVDEIIKADILFGVGMMLRDDPRTRGISAEELAALTREITAATEEARGLNQPFLLRTVRWTVQALSLDWGRSRMGTVIVAGRPATDMRSHVMVRLARTLLLFGVSNLSVFALSVVAALALTHRRGRWIDKAVMALSPLSSAPPWVYGILLTLLVLQVPAFRFVFPRLPSSSWVPDVSPAHIAQLLRQIAVPALSIFLSKFFQSVFLWRSLFLLHYEEHYVELARAKGVPARQLERRHILRPTLPGVLTSFALLLVSMWQEVIILEYFFGIEGVGRMLIRALVIYDTPMVLALVVTFGYLLVLTVFILDIAYALVDPRIRVAGGGRLSMRPARLRAFGRTRLGTEPSPLAAPPPASMPAPAPDARRPYDRPAASLLHRWRTGLGEAASRVRAVRRVAGRTWAGLARYPSALAGLAIIVGLAVVAVYGVLSIPYSEAVVRWRVDPETGYRRPRNALPVWIDVFTGDRLARTTIVDSRSDPVGRTVNETDPDLPELKLALPVDYPFDRFPGELIVAFAVPPVERTPYVALVWRTPDGRELALTELSPKDGDLYRITIDDRLKRRLGADPERALFADPFAPEPTVLKGRHELLVTALFYGEPPALDAELVVHGQLWGAAGTDLLRRDLMVAVLWGTAVALAFGVLAAVGSSLCTVLLAATGAWFGGWVDGAVQRATEVNMVLPFLPVSLMIYTLYSKSFWVVLGVTVALSVFGNALKSYRAVFLQVRQAPYVEAARAYGAGGRRIILRYLMPRIAPVLVPQLMLLVPTYVFLESALSFLGMSDPHLPTWGKLVRAAFAERGFAGPYHVVLVPAILMLAIGIAGALLSHALDRILNPHLDQ